MKLMVLDAGTASLFALLVTAASVATQDSRQLVDAPLPLEQFAVASDGDVLLLPVTFGEKKYLFVLDTGSAITVYDTSLPLGKPKGKAEVETSNGNTIAELFDAPDASVGGLSLRVGPHVLGADLSRLRQVTGHEIAGILGMDFLGKYVVQIDFDRGKVLFLRAAGPKSGQAVPFSRQKQGPQVKVDMPGLERPETFLVDTGSSGYGRLKKELAEGLAKEGNAKKVGDGLTVTLSETMPHRKWQVEYLSLGGFRHRDAVLAESQDNILGLGYWSRYVVTFDFPNSMMYLKRGNAFDRPPDLDRSGLHLLRVQGETVVHSVDAGSPAAVSGVRPNDVIVKIAGERADQSRLFTLRRHLCSDSKELQVAIRRGKVQSEVTITLGEWRR
jgi:hypothetical protein